MKFKLEIDCDNAAFDSWPNAEAEVARILRNAATEIETRQGQGKCRDYNGNTVGSYFFREEA